MGRGDLKMSELPEREDVSLTVEISDHDIYEAMKEIEGYLDITPGDFREVYKLAYGQAMKRITMSVRAGDIMTSSVFAVNGDLPLREVSQLMAAEGISGVPVIDGDNTVMGVISEKDFLSRMGGKDPKSFMGVVSECLKGKGCVALSIRAQKASDIMSSPAVTVHVDTTVGEIADIFTQRNINRVPVIDGQKRLIGIVSRADIVRASRFGRRS